jgi:hypothetical protein
MSATTTNHTASENNPLRTKTEISLQTTTFGQVGQKGVEEDAEEPDQEKNNNNTTTTIISRARKEEGLDFPSSIALAFSQRRSGR